MMNASQMRAGRALIGWSQETLAEKSGVAVATIKRMEKLGTGRSSLDTVEAVKRALTDAGVVFIPENGGGAGVRLDKPE